MKKLPLLLVFIIFSLTLCSDEIADSLKSEIASLPFSYKKGDKIWDLALRQGNELNQPKEAIDNYLKATKIFVKLDSLASAIKTNSSIMVMAYFNPEYFADSKDAFTRHLLFLDNPKLLPYKTTMLKDIKLHLNNAYFIKEMEHLQVALTKVEKYFADGKHDELKVDYDQLSILATNYFYGEEVALEKAMQVYDAIPAYQELLNPTVWFGIYNINIQASAKSLHLGITDKVLSNDDLIPGAYYHMIKSGSLTMYVFDGTQQYSIS